MTTTLRILATCLSLSAYAAHAAPAHTHALSTKPTTTTVEVGGAPMFSNKNIIENAVNSKDHTHLVDAVKAAGLVDTLKGPGPFTVFAPDNAAFEKVPKETIDGLMAPAGHPHLSKILTYHVVPGKLDAKALAEQIKKGKGSAKLKTVAGGILTAKMDGSVLTLTDEMGNTGRATIVDVYQSNGVIHSIDTVLMPK
jgi:uncharacterized surface protein with fasciclin (FAS1) repeats